MKKLTNLFSNIKRYNDNLLLNNEKITIIDRNKIFIQNYKEIIEIDDNFIKLAKIYIKGRDLKIRSVSKYFVEVSGEIKEILLGDVNDEK